MLVIRLKRKGKKNQPFFRIVVADKRTSAKGGRSIDDLGYFDPLTKRSSLNKERVLHWLKVGAQPSDTIHNMLVSEKIIEGTKVNLTKKSKKPVETAQSKPVESTATPVAPTASNPEAAPVAETPTVEPAPTVEAPKVEEVKPTEEKPVKGV